MNLARSLSISLFLSPTLFFSLFHSLTVCSPTRTPALFLWSNIKVKFNVNPYYVILLCNCMSFAWTFHHTHTHTHTHTTIPLQGDASERWVCGDRRASRSSGLFPGSRPRSPPCSPRSPRYGPLCLTGEHDRQHRLNTALSGCMHKHWLTVNAHWWDG